MTVSLFNLQINKSVMSRGGDIVSGAGGDGYALVLDATTFQEIVRVRFPYGLPYGFHGCWIPHHQN
jgi:carotenoid cleavage dioxygenase-like enzyme